MDPFTIFLLWIILGAVFGALFLALSFLVVVRLLKKKTINLRSALLVQGTSLLLCLACLSMATKTAERAIDVAPAPAVTEEGDAPLHPPEQPLD